MDEIINRVAESGIKTIDPEQLIPKGIRSEIDIKKLLFQGLVLREKVFRQFIKETNWQDYKDHFVNITCSTDAIVPNWAYMLIASNLSGIATKVIFGNKKDMESKLLLEAIDMLDLSEYIDQRVIIKGCSDEAITEEAYLNLTFILTPIVKSLLFGEPCSAVPIYKNK
jgi:hypothetical protein